jgi:hypothetical protein
MSVKHLIHILLFALLLPGVTIAQQNDVHPLLDKKWVLDAGAFLPTKEFRFRVDGSLPGDGVDFGDAFRLSNDDSTVAVNLRWRFGEKWSLAGQYWKLSDSSTATLDRDIHWEDVVFEEGSFARAGVGLEVARLFFGRTFSTAERHEFGLGIGLHWLELSASVEGQIRTNMGNSELYRGSVAADAPLPNIGGWYTFAFSPKWALRSRLDWLSASIGDYSGGLTNASIGIDWAIWEHFGVGLSYNYFSLDVDVDKSDWQGATRISQYGPTLKLTAYW